ncbi:hypothetical protein CHGG_11051 [Chaetomium globosum CBS 148.51]|uniref:Cytochrome P450 n=1 Tax=Chaetomium globosum (strain ATCC 6205 / CBS 148.51 / DSM 1962 / NBRC 6347 / NRRL 1970) TaxID=306901 RepID=Q2GM05_CHAGB|nr:uncharacterized protein CHGG_11051 [Chaetomium globosum CBS 148.51]EAQ82875.1 hypothetical protein CHGG_11051 [Chaetomium globosum CBS 148.51]
MAPVVSIALAGLAATYVFLRVLLNLTQDAKEPPAILTGIPFVEPLIGMIREKSRFHTRLRDTTRLPIYTLRLPFQRIYVVNATSLIPLLQKQWRLISFASIAADAGAVVGMSKPALEVMRRDLDSEHGFSPSWPKYIMPAMAPGPDLDAINRPRHRGSTSPSSPPCAPPAPPPPPSTSPPGHAASWSPPPPKPHPSFLPTLHRAREVAAAAMTQYMVSGGWRTGSGLVRRRVEHHADLFGLGLADVGRGELGNAFAVLGNTTPCAFWVLFQLLSDPRVLGDVRRELEALVVVREEVDEESGGRVSVSTIDLAAVREACPVLMSAFQETLRFRAVNVGPRVLLKDVWIDEGRVLLKKGAMLMVPAAVQHTDREAWGEDAAEFDHLRFVPASAGREKRRKPNRVAFRAFGGGHVLCPGRHFASTEILSLAALLVLQFDVVPVAGRWVEPTWENSPAQAGFPIIDQDIPVELRPRGPQRKWKVVYSGTDKAMDIVSEDIAAGGRGAL